MPHGLIGGHHQIGARDHRERQRHDPHVLQKLGGSALEKDPAEGRKRDQLPDRRRDQAEEQRKGGEVVGGADALFPVGSHVLGDDGDRCHTEGIARRGEQIDGLVVGGIILIRRAEGVCLEGFPQNADEPRQHRDQHDAADGAAGAPLPFRGRALIHDAAQKGVVLAQTLHQLFHMGRGAVENVLPPLQYLFKCRPEALQRKLVDGRNRLAADGLQKSVDLGVVGDADAGHAHHAGIDQRMEPHAHQHVQIADDRKHLVGKMLVRNGVHVVPQPFRQRVDQIQVLLVMEGNEHRIGIAVLLQITDGAGGLLQKAGLVLGGAGAFQRPAHQQTTLLPLPAHTVQDRASRVRGCALQPDHRVGGDADELIRDLHAAQKLGRRKVADADAVGPAQQQRREPPVEARADGADALGIDKDLFPEQQRHVL